MVRAVRVVVTASVVVAGVTVGALPSAGAAAPRPVSSAVSDALPSVCQVVGTTATCTYTVPNSPRTPSYTLDVPAGSTGITVEAAGAAGGSELSTGRAFAPAQGGLGARVTAAFGNALAGQTLTVVVGQTGFGGLDTVIGAPPMPGGFPDGGAGGQSTDIQAAGGGGSSRVSAADGSPLVIAGGGGGAGQSHRDQLLLPPYGISYYYGLGGAGGLAGGNGVSGGAPPRATYGSVDGGPGGQGAVGQTGGYSGGYAEYTHSASVCAPGSSSGYPGANGTPGAGGAGASNTLTPGGGGGGGWAGGAGGSAGARCHSPYVKESYGGGGGGGGGGSSFAAVPVSPQKFFNNGSGRVVVTFTLAPTVTTVTAPTALTKSPFVVSFSRPVKGVTPSSLTLVEVGPIALGGSVACRDATDSVVSCSAGPVTTARLTPTRALIAGEYYFINVNQTTPSVVGYADAIAVPPTQRYLRAKTDLTAFDYPVRYTWPRVANAAALGGSYVQENGGGQSESFNASGSSLGVVTWNGPDGGTATVSVSTTGQPTVTRTIDTYAPVAGGVTTTIGNLPAGSHTVTVTADGAKNPASTGTWVRIDATVVGAVVNPTPALTASTWRNYPGAYAYTFTKSATVSLRFRGTGIDWTALVGPNNGRARVVIDGVTVAAAQDLYAAGYSYQTFSYTVPDGFHTVVITCLGTKQPASSDKVITVKSLTVR